MEKELKYVFALERTPVLENWLTSFCQIQKQYPKNVITSIYFDTDDLRHLSEKRNSDFLKYKFRVRWYKSCECGSYSPAIAEVKTKEGPNRSKIRFQIDLPAEKLEEMQLCSDYLMALPGKLAALGFDVGSIVKPVIRITYERKRYLHISSSTSINVDTQIQPDKVSPYYISSFDNFPLELTVCEVKGQASRLPPELFALTSLGGRRTAFSKYYECYRAATMQYVV